MPSDQASSVVPFNASARSSSRPARHWFNNRRAQSWGLRFDDIGRRSDRRFVVPDDHAESHCDRRGAPFEVIEHCLPLGRGDGRALLMRVQRLFEEHQRV
jgi:hypothetical protein